ncbi:unnamed protein product [Clonostachys rosea f. rosea IK726]|uniref:Uncharacterized protein n=1 Tax=Clonostachys rosea f. rosea IK726 TaxID=1349383 RepID=A0ACA9UQT9_BIOOC|nr:unnamed protein product [Clonostachys rosea f. rosea IK726]
MEAQGRFKVLIAGAGITGLTLAHCLEKADIDYTLFDKGIIAPPFGNTITIFPHGIRILHQLDFLNQIKNQSAPMGGSNCRGSNGKIFAACEKYFTVLRSLTGYDTRTIGRQEFLQLMYDRLPDKRKVFERARVERVVTENSKIRLVLADGREFIGDLLVGADGVHSKVRELMWNNATRIVPTMKTTYAAIVGLSMPMSDLETFEAVVNTSHNKISFLVICQPKWVSWQVFTKLREDEQFCGPDRRKFGEEDMKVLIEKIADYPITEKVKFAELWENRTRAQMVSLEEGVFDHWFLDRIVLAGDAAHKVTPNSGFGGSTAMEDAKT